MEYHGFDGAMRELPVGRGRFVLINLFASWCAPCVEELGELARREREVRARGIDVVALAVDGLGDDRTGPEAARELIDRLGFPFAAGRATKPLLHMLQYLHDAAIPLHRPLPLPASFLTDGSGRLQSIVKGRLRIDDLLADSALPALDGAARRLRAAALPGEALRHPLVDAAWARFESRTRFQYAGDLARTGRSADAMAEYLELLELEPNFAEAHINLALLHLGKGELEAAERRFRRALEIRPGLAEAHFNLAGVLERKGDPAAAEAAYERALELRPGYPGANNALGLLLARAGRLEPAAIRFAEEARLHPEAADAHNHLGLVHLQRGREDEARACFERAVALAPDLADAHNNLGIVLRRQGDVAAAEAAYRQAIRIQPGFAEAHNNLGLALLHQGKADEAARHFARALEIDPAFEPARANLQRARALPKKP